MSAQAENYLIAAMCIVFGALIVLARNWFARSAMQGLRGFRKDFSSEKVRRFWSGGMAVFGLVIILIGIWKAVSAAPW